MTEPIRETAEPTRDIAADHMVETPTSLRDDDPEVTPMDRGAEAGDRPLASEKFGTTRAEQLEGEPLDSRLAQEVPDVHEDQSSPGA